MQTSFNDYFNENNKNENLIKQIAKAKAKHKEKLFVEEFFGLNKLANFSIFVFSAFSILTGFYFLYSNFIDMIGFVFSAFFAVLLLVILETVKHYLSKLFFARAFKQFKGTELVLLLLLIAYFAASVFLSVFGAKALYKELDMKEKLFVKDTQSKESSLINSYNAKIKSLELELQKAQNTYRQNIYSTASQKQILYYQSQIENLNKDKTKELAKIEKSSNLALTEIKQVSGFNVVFWIVLSLTNEVLILLCLFFNEYYDFKVFKQGTFLQTKNDFQNLVQNIVLNLQGNNALSNITNFANNEPVITNSQNSQNIGFKMSAKTAKERTHGPVNNEPVKTNPLQNNQNTCLHCANEYQRKTHTQKFCTEKCRIAHWELRKGKKLFFGKSK